ncbi:aminoglycoside phosphotransferase family protein [Streptomyces sp. MI02-7b]|uniref:phosphotransferase family protein n=1 Tax=Streptomyces sp. MI02-7b TaxID=462941 RepID=UPI0029AC1099|nr:aminoglycoside phosphotransferase family protein [Streptomyces sp. MI02-7b]MDX3074925.1 aminoglycoside phosphotransferase family protein [Streptomyces sp. MI02-7b]
MAFSGERAATRSRVDGQLAGGERVVAAERLRGGWTSQMRLLRTTAERHLVLRSFVTPFYRRHAEGLLDREAAVLTLLAGRRRAGGPAGGRGPDGAALRRPLAADDPAAGHRVPGRARRGAARRADLLARQLAAVHAVRPPESGRPRPYQAWTSPERVGVPEGTPVPRVWERAVAAIRRAPPPYQGCFLHRDCHPGNVLFADGAVSGVVDWVETSWGPADLDVAHCATALALLHGPQEGMAYAAAGGRPLADGAAHLYWRLLDAPAFAPDAEKVAVPWRELGRTDLTPGLPARRLEASVDAVLERYA